MNAGVFLFIYLICGVIAAVIATSKGRSGIGWFFGGAFLGLIGIIIVAVLPNLKEEEARRKHAMAERRRLREQLRQEKMKTESFRHHASYRLDTHDSALGVDTRRTPGLTRGAAPVPPLVSDTAPPPLPARPSGRAWFYEEDGKSKGPVPESTLVRMLGDGELDRDALVWTEGQPEWVLASVVEALWE
ncbi:MAG: GYF domain-containing protein [Planctomycetota bacterium]